VLSSNRRFRIESPACCDGNSVGVGFLLKIQVQPSQPGQLGFKRGLCASPKNTPRSQGCGFDAHDDMPRQPACTPPITFIDYGIQHRCPLFARAPGAIKTTQRSCSYSRSLAGSLGLRLMTEAGDGIIPLATPQGGSTDPLTIFLLLRQ